MQACAICQNFKSQYWFFYQEEFNDTRIDSLILKIDIPILLMKPAVLFILLYIAHEENIRIFIVHIGKNISYMVVHYVNVDLCLRARACHYA